MIRILWAIRAIFYKLRFKAIGSQSYMGRPIFLKGTRQVSLGKRVRIFPGARIETHGDGHISIGDNVSIGQNLHIVSGKSVTIQANTTISSNVMITDLNHGYEIIDQHIMDQPHQLLETTIGENSFIGTGAVILPGSHLGRQVIVGANAVVSGTFPDYCVIAGVPARIVKRYNAKTERWEKNV